MLSRSLGILIMSAPFAMALAALPPSPPTHGVRIENTWIPMSDGIRLAVTLDLHLASWVFPAGHRYKLPCRTRSGP